MEIDKSQIIEMLKSRGDHDTAKEADKSLPDTVDTDKDAGMLARFGIDPAALIGKLGGLGGLAGGLGKLSGH